ncbi:hypothetical protein ACTOJ1_000942 [Shigella flexneri]
MSVCTKGFVLMNEEQKDIINILDTIKTTCEEIFREQAKKVFDSLPTEYKEGRRPIWHSLPKEEKEKFSHPVVEYSSGFFQAHFSYSNDNGEREQRSISIFTDKKFSNDINNEFDDFENPNKRSGIILSFNKWGDSEKIMTRILEKFALQYPSFLLKDDCAGVHNTPENLVKIGSAIEPEYPVVVSPAKEPEIKPETTVRRSRKP